MSKHKKKQVGGEHYIKLKIQPWDAMKAWMTAEEFAGFLRGNAIKYLARDKNRIEDLEKARHTLKKLSKHYKKVARRARPDLGKK